MINFIIRENKTLFQSRFCSSFVCLTEILLVSDRFLQFLLSLNFWYSTAQKIIYEVLKRQKITKKCEDGFSDTFWIVMAKHDLRQLRIDIKDTSISINNYAALNWTLKNSINAKGSWIKLLWCQGNIQVLQELFIDFLHFKSFQRTVWKRK